ncbi:hypothetical protein C8R43DRAFT_955163 [Mycena crocata]|nr:hypothetical protein C8R43DRAFT_955163 [Mycena crocata]
MPPSDLTPVEVAAVITPNNHLQRLTMRELELLTSHFTASEMERLVNLLRLKALGRQLPSIMNKIIVAVRRMSDNPPQYDDDIETVTRIFEDSDLLGTDVLTPPPSSPELLSTPVRRPTVRSMPSTPNNRVLSSPTSTRQRQDRATATTKYVVRSGVNSTEEYAVNWFEAGSLTQGVPGSSPPAAAHIVFFGGEVDVFESWSAASCSVTGHGLAIHSGFSSLTEARAALAYARQRGWTANSIASPSTLPTALPIPSSYDDNPLNTSSRSSDCLNTSGVKGNLCNVFDTRKEAEAALASAYKAGWVRSIAPFVSLQCDPISHFHLFSSNFF